jgi:hypothetical protein
MGDTGRIPIGVPILGQIATVTNWCAQIVGRCNCEGKHPLLVVLGQIGECAGCHRKFTIQQVQFNANTGQCSIELALVMTRDELTALQEVEKVSS